MRVYVGSDHAGFELKKEIIEFLSSKGYEVQECKFQEFDKYDDFNDAAIDVVRKILSDEKALGILICGTGIGMSMMANRHKGIRAAVCSNLYEAEISRTHNDSNIMCLGARVLESGLSKEMCLKFLETPFSGEEIYIRRNKRLDE